MQTTKVLQCGILGNFNLIDEAFFGWGQLIRPVAKKLEKASIHAMMSGRRTSKYDTRYQII